LEIKKEKLYAEQTLAYILNKLRNHDQIIKNLHEMRGEGWRKMKYARGLFDRSVGFVSSNEVNKEYIYLTEPFHCRLISSSKKLCNELSPKYEIELKTNEELFSESDIIIIQGEANDFTEEISEDLLKKMKKDALLVLASDDIKINKEFFIKILKDGSINALVWDGFDFSDDKNKLQNVMLAKQSVKN